jgi:hypothetical protein
MEISLKDFIRSGWVGPICLGASRELIERALGSPTDFSEPVTSKLKLEF